MSNMLLDTLPQNVSAALKPNLRTVDLAFGQVLANIDEPVERVIFPLSGVVSVVVEMEPGDMIETAMVGRDGVINGASALDSMVSLQKALVQLPGSALAITPDALRKVANEFEILRSVLVRHEILLRAQCQQSAGCNASHTVESRMGRWLLRMRDLTQSNDLKLTQEFLAQMLGVRRTSVSLVAGALQRSGLISYRRGNIQILDVEGLHAATCECYDRVNMHYRRMAVPTPSDRATVTTDHR